MCVSCLECQLFVWQPVIKLSVYLKHVSLFSVENVCSQSEAAGEEDEKPARQCAVSIFSPQCGGQLTERRRHPAHRYCASSTYLLWSDVALPLFL